jgi:hypothetical protein
MGDTAEMIVPLLREMRAENAVLHEEMLNELELIERRLRSLEERQASFKQTLAADSLLGRLVSGSSSSASMFERKMRELERLK